MRIIADLHIHSKYSRAVSREMLLENLDAWADDKGITVMGTGDFTHPEWVKEIKKKLEPAEAGLFKLKKEFKKRTLKGTEADTRFMLTTEISSIYSRGGKTRRVHNLVFAPSIGTIEKINKELGRVGNLKSDGRPIIGIDSEDLLKLVLEVDERAVLIPAHAWTPWFSVFGSMSGFDSLEECFGDYAKYIFAIETGLSSHPPMNWRVSALDNVALISNSDSHSLERIGREANIFDTELSYDGIIEAIKSGAPDVRRRMSEVRRPKTEIQRQSSDFGHQTSDTGPRTQFLETIEFFPEEGKYHIDGHRLCGISFMPKESKKHNLICPKCGRKLTIGVLHRVEELADRAEDFKDEARVSFRNLVTLDQIIGEALDLGPKTKSVFREYEKLIKVFGSELNILMEADIQKIAMNSKVEITEGIKRVREGKLKIKPGYDGEYGEVHIFDKKEREKLAKQNSLF